MGVLIKILMTVVINTITTFFRPGLLVSSGSRTVEECSN
jgi:hypothetical protein